MSLTKKRLCHTDPLGEVRVSPSTAARSWIPQEPPEEGDRHPIGLIRRVARVADGLRRAVRRTPSTTIRCMLGEPVLVRHERLAWRDTGEERHVENPGGVERWL